MAVADSGQSIRSAARAAHEAIRRQWTSHPGVDRLRHWAMRPAHRLLPPHGAERRDDGNGKDGG